MSSVHFQAEEVAVIQTGCEGKPGREGGLRVESFRVLHTAYLNDRSDYFDRLVVQRKNHICPLLKISDFNKKIMLKAHPPYTQQANQLQTEQDFRNAAQLEGFTRFLRQVGTEDLFVDHVLGWNGIRLQFRLNVQDPSQWKYIIRESTPGDRMIKGLADRANGYIGKNVLRLLAANCSCLTEFYWRGADGNVAEQDLLMSMSRNVDWQRIQHININTQQRMVITAYFLTCLMSRVFANNTVESFKVASIAPPYPSFNENIRDLLIKASTVAANATPMLFYGVQFHPDSLSALNLRPLFEHMESPRCTLSVLRLGHYYADFIIRLGLIRPNEEMDNRRRFFEMTISGRNGASAILAAAPTTTKLKVLRDSNGDINLEVLEAFRNQHCMVWKLDIDSKVCALTDETIALWARCLNGYGHLTYLSVSVAFQSDTVVPHFCPSSSLHELRLKVFGPTDFGTLLPMILREQTSLHTLAVVYGGDQPDGSGPFDLRLLESALINYSGHITTLQLTLINTSTFYHRSVLMGFVLGALGLQKLQTFIVTQKEDGEQGNDLPPLSFYERLLSDQAPDSLE